MILFAFFFCCQEKYFISDKHRLLLVLLICILLSRLVSYSTQIIRHVESEVCFAE